MQNEKDISLRDLHEFAANYSDRQGLRVVPLALAVMVQAFPGWNLPTVIGVDPMIVALALGFAGYWAAGRYYRRAFGAVEELPHEGLPFSAQLLIAGVFLCASLVVDLRVHPPVFVSGLIVAGWLAITAWPSRRVRGQYTSIAVALSLVALAPLTGEAVAEVGRTYAFCFGVLLLLAGVRDHMVFLRFVTPLEEQHE